MEVEDGADVGVAGVGTADARGIGDHGLELGADVGFGLGQHDGVVVALGHLAAVEAGSLGEGVRRTLGSGRMPLVKLLAETSAAMISLSEWSARAFSMAGVGWEQ